MGNFNSTKMNWIFFGCLVVVGLPALALASGCDKKEAPLCVSADVPKTPEAKPKPYDCNKCYIDAVARQFAEVDIWIPKCDPKGDWFVKEQYNKVKNEAFCVTKYGDEFAGSRIKGNKVDCSKFPANSYKCLEAKADADRRSSAGIIGHFTPSCEADGSYSPEQCHGSTGYCWCTLADGKEVPGTRLRGAKRDCRVHRTSDAKVSPKATIKKCLLERSKAKKTGKKHIPQCDKKGDYLSVQCGKQGWCWCAQHDGNPVPATFFNKNGPKAKLQNCDKHRAVKYNCVKDGSMEHPFDCNRYIICSPSKIYNCVCPKGQMWDSKLRICTWKELAVCPTMSGK